MPINIYKKSTNYVYIYITYISPINHSYWSYVHQLRVPEMGEIPWIYPPQRPGNGISPNDRPNPGKCYWDKAQINQQIQFRNRFYQSH